MENLGAAIWDVFFRVFEESVKEECKKRIEVTSQKAANAAYDKQMKEEDMGGGGFITGYPFSETTIAYTQTQLTNCERDTKEARAMMNFLKDRFLVDFEVTNTLTKP